MKIVVDAIPLLSPLTGIGQYTYEISKRIQKQTEVEFYYGYYSKELISPQEHRPIKHVKAFIDKFPVVKKFIKKGMHLVKSFENYDLYWEPNFIPHKNIKAKKIVTTVHDFSFLNPAWHTKEKIEYYRKFFKKNVLRNDRIITDSYFVKNEAIEYLGIDEKKIETIYLGVDHDIFKSYDENVLNDFRTQYSLPEKFVLFVGSLEPRKNLLNLLRAYELLPKIVKKEYPLILAGFSGWNNGEIVDFLERNRENIRYLGYLERKSLAYLYNMATLFVYPSLYEGFGLPPLEAMACGTSVLVSNVSSLPEVCADAVWYCDPKEIEDIKDKMIKLLENDSLRKRLSHLGKQRASKFDWDHTAQKHIEVFEGC